MGSKKVLGNLFNGKCTNISVIKFVLALLVIFSHSYAICLGIDEVDPVSRITNNQLSLGNFSVCIFLLFSGFLITRSLERDNYVLSFFRKRIVKIIPPLFLTILFTVFIVGPLFCECSIVDYFSNCSWLLYLVKNTFLITTHTIKGLFEGNIYYQSINGSLWTLPVEFLCYIGCFVAFKLGIVKRKTLKYTLPLFLVIILFKSHVYNFFPSIVPIFPLLFFFYIGVIYYVYRDKIILSTQVFIVSILVLITGIIFNFYSYVVVFFLPYIVMYLAFYIPQWSFGKKKIFSLSYEIYLLGFLIQQIVIYCFNGSMNPILNFLIATSITICLAYVLNYISNFAVKCFIKEKR